MPKFWQRRPELLLLPNIPKPLHGINPRTVLGSGWWNKERQEAYASTNYHCEACGTHKSQVQGRKILEGHEVYHTDYRRGKLTYVRTTPLCPWCHKYIHDGRLFWLLDTGQITHYHYSKVLRHGDKVLAEAGHHRPRHHEREAEIQKQIHLGTIAPPEDWRLVVFGAEYCAELEL